MIKQKVKKEYKNENLLWRVSLFYEKSLECELYS